MPQQSQESNTEKQGVPLSPKQQALAQQVEGQIQEFEKQLETKSNDDLKQIATKLESVERAMLLEKIDNQLHTIKNTAVEPGDGASPAAAGADAAVAVAIQQTN